ncbi:Rne/Rng family ribonuclease [Candidatus Nitrosacidococcus sp. I8]|uniref:Rne/Rng family ribonuclease n=1 Tax=Candidatus Nitrosacidococcus sp. I8 TaxID=2942908 RepID=UPI00222751C6|nr:Rne/Rng family ribonuclease [Candidatus Nitrosacidococcus sp. I8]CAH9019288.1 Ribonuclease E [Candidatus Nitrosacidococcus sp. I8]
MKKMLINGTHPEELRVAMVNGQKLQDLDIENASRGQKKGNIYKGKITRVEPSLEAVFVDYGTDRQGFLPLKDISNEYFRSSSELSNESYPKIQDLLKEGQELIVQIEKEERGNKGAALSTFISLAGKYLVLMPNSPKAGGVSRRIEGQERSSLLSALNMLDIPEGIGLIARTAAANKDEKELKRDFDYLIHLWQVIKTAAEGKKAPFLIYQESDVIIRALRDHLHLDVDEILIDTPSIYQRAYDFMCQVIPNELHKLKLYQDKISLFARFDIENQVESAFEREVHLSSGGAIVIDYTEALTAIDVNSARANKGEDIQATALSTNLEAAEEIARQLRLRDLGGLIVIDFIDMAMVHHQRSVEHHLKKCLRADRARIQVGRISRFGILEMSRQRLRPSLGDTYQTPCSSCEGKGYIRGIESFALSVLRHIEEKVTQEKLISITIQLPVPIASFLLNKKRTHLAAIEKRYGIELSLIPNSQIETSIFEFEKFKGEEKEEKKKEQINTSFDMKDYGFLFDTVKEDPIDTKITKNTSNPKEESISIETVPIASKEDLESNILPFKLKPTLLKTQPGFLTHFWKVFNHEDLGENRLNINEYQNQSKPHHRNSKKQYHTSSKSEEVIDCNNKEPSESKDNHNNSSSKPYHRPRQDRNRYRGRYHRTAASSKHSQSYKENKTITQNELAQQAIETATDLVIPESDSQHTQ